MTLIQPRKTPNYFFIISLLLALPLLASVVGIIVVYNQVVDARHEVSQLTRETKDTEAENAEIKDKIFAILNASSLEDFASAHQLVKDNQPRFVVADKIQRWEVASHF